MRVAALLPVSVVLASMIAACATTPNTVSTAAAPTPPRVTPTAAAEPADADEKKFDYIDASNIAEAQAAGYKVVNEKGTTLLCKKSLLTGTRLHYVTTCLTASEWRETTQAAKDGVKPNPVYKPTRGN